MNFTALSAAQTTNEVSNALSLAEKGILSAKVTLTGIVVVFVMLFLLILIIQIYGAIVYKATNKAEKKKKVETVVEKSVTAPVPTVNSNGVSDEVVAVISAAVASMYGSTEKVKIKSIKKSSATRTPWANAGVLNNTRPF